MWPGSADKHVSLIYGRAVKWLLRAVNIRPVSFWRQLHRSGEEEDKKASFVEKRIFKLVGSLPSDSWFWFAVVIEFIFSAQKSTLKKYSINERIIALKTKVRYHTRAH